MDDRFKNWMKNELDIEWSKASTRTLNPAVVTDLSTYINRIVIKDKIEKVELKEKNIKIAEAVERKQASFGRKKLPVIEPETNYEWNVFASLLEKATEPDNQQVFRLKPDDFNTDTMLDDFDAALKALADFHQNPDQFLADNPPENPPEPPSQSSYENTKNLIEQEFKDIHQSFVTLKELLKEPSKGSPESPENPAEDSVPDLEKLKCQLAEWSKLFN